MSGLSQSAFNSQLNRGKTKSAFGQSHANKAETVTGFVRESARMRWQEIGGDGVSPTPRASSEKTGVDLHHARGMIEIAEWCRRRVNSRERRPRRKIAEMTEGRMMIRAVESSRCDLLGW